MYTHKTKSRPQDGIFTLLNKLKKTTCSSNGRLPSNKGSQLTRAIFADFRFWKTRTSGFGTDLHTDINHQGNSQLNHSFASIKGRLFTFKYNFILCMTNSLVHIPPARENRWGAGFKKTKRQNGRIAVYVDMLKEIKTIKSTNLM